MVDYKFLGSRIREIRFARNLTQEKLAEAVGVGTTHISHIETGNTTPSLQTLLDIINTLGCSADELLCMEVQAARPYRNSWLSELVADCNSTEVKLITDTVIALKHSLRRLKISDEYENS